MRDGEAPPPKADPDRPLLEDLRERLGRAWRGLLAPGTRCALALYPDHWNVGDAAIWWGTRRLLAGLGVEVAYGCDPWSYDPHDLRRALPDGPILLLGGESLGLRTGGRTLIYPEWTSESAERRQVSNLWNTLGTLAGEPLDDFGDPRSRLAPGPLPALVG